MDDEKERQIEIQSLRKENEILRAKILNNGNYHDWDHDDILHWILNLDNKRFMKYENKLRENLNEEEPSGQYLADVNEQDIKRWGIKKFGDIKDLKKHIDNLVNGKQMNDDDDDIALPNIEGAASGGHFK